MLSSVSVVLTFGKERSPEGNRVIGNRSLLAVYLAPLFKCFRTLVFFPLYFLLTILGGY